MNGGQALYSITSSARSSIGGGKWRPIALAVLRLTNRENLVGSSTGISLGVAFLSNLSTYTPARRKTAGTFGPYDISPPDFTNSSLLNMVGRPRASASAAIRFRSLKNMHRQLLRGWQCFRR